MQDQFQRKIEYLRISVTDCCNLRCRYCMPAHGVKKMAHADVLTYEEILRNVRALAGMGIRKVRLTGGAPPGAGLGSLGSRRMGTICR